MTFNFDMVQRLCWTKGITVAPESVYDAMLTKQDAMKRLNNLFAVASDLYVVIYAGHGREGSGDWMLAGGDTSFADLLATWRFKGHLLLILDSCHSGFWASRACALNCPVLAVQASCAAPEEALDGVFLSAWCLIQQGELDARYALDHMQSLKRKPQMSVPSNSHSVLLERFPFFGDQHAVLFGEVAPPLKLNLVDLGAKQAFDERFHLVRMLETEPEDECFACISRMITGIPAEQLDFPLIVRALVEGLRCTQSPKCLRALALCCGRQGAWRALRNSDAVNLTIECCRAGISAGLETLREMSAVQILRPMICTAEVVQVILASQRETQQKLCALWNICRSSELIRALVRNGGAELVVSALDTEWGARLCWLLVQDKVGASAILSAQPDALDILHRCAQDIDGGGVQRRKSKVSRSTGRSRSSTEQEWYLHAAQQLVKTLRRT